MKKGLIEVIGGKVWYEIVGEDKNNTPLLVLHGGPGISHDYLEDLKVLADERPVIFYDQLGCGNSDKTSDKNLWQVARYVEELVEVRQFLELENLHILGQSWGTMLAVEYMLTKNPTGIKSLILSGPALSISRWIKDQRAYLKELPKETQECIIECEKNKDFQSEKYQKAIDVYYHKHVCQMDPWPECLDRSLSKMNLDIYEYMCGPSEFTVSGVLKSFERAEDLKNIKPPVLYTCGRYDEATPETTAYYKNLTPNAEMVIFEDASHEHHLEKKEEFIKVVREFLQK
ncbi:MAG: proline iminopeptidase-family hydrolase [Candidatus Omnitrophota bacterium]